LHFRLVAFDLDGTLMARQQPITSRVKTAVQQALAKGTIVTLASGRLFSMLLPYAQQLGITTPLIAHHGALIKDPVTGDVLFHRGVPLDLAHEVIQLARDRGLPAAAYLEDEVYTDRICPSPVVDGWIKRIKAHDVGDLAQFLTTEPTRVAVVTEDAQTKTLVLELRAHFGDRLHVTSGHPLLTEMSHPDVSKARALDRLIQHFGISRDEVLAVGDDWNDVEMLRFAGFGVAMGDAPIEVQEAADYTAPSALDDGAAHVLEKFIFGYEKGS
jgi:Cof subfamily protein (haloacid dehalogenase superfamily)